jgi:DNA-binding MarR family transcriptional regulator
MLCHAERMTTSEFFTLAHLAEAPGGRLRMGDLAEVTALSLSATTKVVTKLETAGLVVRERSAGDRRGQEARLTASGSSRLDGSRSVWLASMRCRLFDKLQGADLASLTAALQRISHDG